MLLSSMGTSGSAQNAAIQILTLILRNAAFAFLQSGGNQVTSGLDSEHPKVFLSTFFSAAEIPASNTSSITNIKWHLDVSIARSLSCHQILGMLA